MQSFKEFVEKPKTWRVTPGSKQKRLNPVNVTAASSKEARELAHTNHGINKEYSSAELSWTKE